MRLSANPTILTLAILSLRPMTIGLLVLYGFQILFLRAQVVSARLVSFAPVCGGDADH